MILDLQHIAQVTHFNQIILRFHIIQILTFKLQSITRLAHRRYFIQGEKDVYFIYVVLFYFQNTLFSPEHRWKGTWLQCGNIFERSKRLIPFLEEIFNVINRIKSFLGRFHSPRSSVRILWKLIIVKEESTVREYQHLSSLQSYPCCAFSIFQSD